MKVSVPTKVLNDLISRTEKITSKKSALPILSNIYFQISGSELLIRATNLEIGIEGVITVEHEAGDAQESSFALSASLVKNFLQQVRSSKKITLEIADGNVVFYSDMAEATIATVSAEEFPTLPEVGDDSEVSSLKLSAEEFINGVAAVWYASATSTMKPELSSVYIHTHNNELFFVATDTFRLAEKVVSSDKVPDNVSLLIPQLNAQELTKVIRDDEELNIEFDQNLLQISQKNLRITARVVDGSFPDYRQIIPSEYTTEATVLFYDMENALKLSSVFADRYHQVTMEFNDDSVVINSKGTEAGKSKAVIKASVDGESVSTRFNQRYLSEPLSSLRGDNLIMRLSPNKPMMLSNPSDNTFRYLVMPMHQ